MLKDIEVKKIAPAHLPDLLWFMLKHKYHMEQRDFVVAFDGKNQIMYVDKKIPDDDVQKFVRAASWPEGNINDPDCPIAETVDYIYETYGWNVWSIILDNHRSRYEKIETAKAQERAAELLPLIRGEINAVIDGGVPDPFNGRLVSCLSDAGREKDRGRDMSGCETGTDIKYVFYLGYLMGQGKIKDDFTEAEKRECWIPVSEMLPPEPIPEPDPDYLPEYIVMIIGAQLPTTLLYEGNGKWWDAATDEWYPVVAWRPMPESYKPGGDTEKCSETEGKVIA